MKIDVCNDILRVGDENDGIVKYAKYYSGNAISKWSIN